MKRLMKAAALCAAVATLAATPLVAQNEGGLRAPAGGGTGAALAGSSASVFAVAVRFDGTATLPSDGIGVASVTKLADGPGRYQVIFRKRNLHTACFWTGTVADRDDGVVTPGIVAIDARTGTNNGLYVATYDTAGSQADRSFIVNVICRN